LAHLENPQPPPLYLEFPFSKSGTLNEIPHPKKGEKAA
jgi:hypothetical protein